MLLEKLSGIIGKLEQVNGITMNQYTVLLESISSKEDGERIDKVIREMASYKEELINQVEQDEIEFEKEYYLVREKIIDQDEINQLKNRVSQVIQLKEKIMENEKANMMLVQSRLRQKNKAITIPKDSKKIVEIYKNSSLR